MGRPDDASLESIDGGLGRVATDRSAPSPRADSIVFLFVPQNRSGAKLWRRLAQLFPALEAEAPALGAAKTTTAPTGEMPLWTWFLPNPRR